MRVSLTNIRFSFTIEYSNEKYASSHSPRRWHAATDEFSNKMLLFLVCFFPLPWPTQCRCKEGYDLGLSYFVSRYKTQSQSPIPGMCYATKTDMLDPTCSDLECSYGEGMCFLKIVLALIEFAGEGIQNGYCGRPIC